MKRVFLLAVMACYLAFAYFLYNRWLATEFAAGGAVPFPALIGGTNLTGVSIQRISWATVLTPLWIADALTVVAHAALLAVQHAWHPTHAASLNAKLEHTSGASRAILYAMFKALLVHRLAPDERPDAPPPMSWWAVFSPVYAAAILQMILHSCKTLEGGETLFRGRDSSRPRRRPGFALTLDDTLAFNISLHLNGVFYLRNATWSIVFWPLWLVAAICGVGLFLLLCFGVPMLSRRYPTRQFLMVLPPLLLLMATYSLALQALLKGISWLDAPRLGVTSTDVMGPAIAAAWCLWLLLAVVTLSALWHVPGVPPPDGEGENFRGEPPSYESLSGQMPALLVRESSTLFRQVSARTLDAYNKRYGKLVEEPEATDEEEDDDLEAGEEPEPVPALEPASCWVCFADTIRDEAVLLHCGHAGLCLGCADNLWRRRLQCPMCRQPISLVARVGDMVAVDGKLVVSPSLPTREALAGALAGSARGSEGSIDV